MTHLDLMIEALVALLSEPLPLVLLGLVAGAIGLVAWIERP